MKHFLKSTLFALVVTSASCFAGDMKTDIQALYTKTLPAYATDQLTETFQGFNAFWYKEGYKFPGYLIYNRGPGTVVSSIVCGTKQNGRVYLIKDPEHLENLVPVRRFLHEPYPNMKVDEKYEGYCETSFGKAFYRIAHATFFKKKEFKGKIIIDEYNSEKPSPFYFLLGSIRDFHGLKAYLAPHLQDKTTKPLLLLKIDKQGDDEFTTDDKAFLTNYFTLLDPNNDLVKRFFENADSVLFDTQKIFKDARTVGQKFGDLATSNIEKIFGEFKYENMAMIIAGLALAGWGLPKLWNMGKGGITNLANGTKANPAYQPKEKKLEDQEFIDDPERKATTEKVIKGLKYAAIGGASLVAASFVVAWLDELTGREPLTRTKKAPKAPKAA